MAVVVHQLLNEGHRAFAELRTHVQLSLVFGNKERVPIAQVSPVLVIAVRVCVLHCPAHACTALAHSRHRQQSSVCC